MIASALLRRKRIVVNKNSSSTQCAPPHLPALRIAAPSGLSAADCLLRTGRNGQLISGAKQAALFVGLCAAAKAFSLGFSTSRIRECATVRWN